MAPPSRHLWVGNVPQGITEGDLARLFSRFGEITRIAFLPGRNYAFIDLRGTDEGIAAMEALDSFPVDGNPLRVEFAKEKSSAPSRNEDYLEHRDPQRSSERVSSKFRHSSPDQYHPDKSKITEKSSESEPSEVLWVGFPAQLKVDETILWKAFSPFGEIEKITAFPGRTYAFIRFRDLISASRAKETLQGKLFGNPRVHICFARSETGGPIGGKSSMATPMSPQFKSRGQDFGGIRSPRFVSNLVPEDPDVYSMNRRSVLRNSADRSFGYDQRRFSAERSEIGYTPYAYGGHDSPVREKRGNFHYPSQKGHDFDPWDLPEETDHYPGAKRPRTSAFPPDSELSEYDFSDLRREGRAVPRVISESFQSEPFDRRAGRNIRYQEMPDRLSNPVASYGENNDRLRVYYDNAQIGSGPQRSIERTRVTPEVNGPSLQDWKWEGTIAKGGTSICRARCFPVGKAPDMMLPEFLDCTARTSLEMLSKHYYQAAGAWVVFFVPGSDSDIGFYNEFMYYLEEKQRAAVAKLDERTTMFLVPPSDFSQKVLKVAGSLSISGVILRLENSPTSKVVSLHCIDQVKDRHDHPELLRPSRESRPYSGSDVGASLDPGIRQDLPYRDLLTSTSGPRNNVPLQVPNRASASGQEMFSSQFAGGSFGFPSSSNSNNSRAPPVHDPELLAQLTSSLFRHQGQPSSAPNAPMGSQNQPDNPFRGPDDYNFSNIRGSSEVQRFQPHHQSSFSGGPTLPAAAPRQLQSAGAPQGNQQVPSSGVQEGGENDPQKRLQATIQLAAALLQQIQQGKGP